MREARDAAERDVAAVGALREAAAVPGRDARGGRGRGGPGPPHAVEREALAAAATAARDEVARLTGRDIEEAAEPRPARGGARDGGQIAPRDGARGARRRER